MCTLYCCRLQTIHSGICHIRCPQCSGMAFWRAHRYDLVHIPKNQLPLFLELLKKEARRILWIADSQFGKNRYLLDRFPQLPKSSSSVGIVDCPSCGFQKAQTIKWPQDAYFQIDVRGHTLWAYCKQHMLDILAFLQSKQRDAFVRNFSQKLKKQNTENKKNNPESIIPPLYPFETFRFAQASESFLRLPHPFICAKNREDITRKIMKLLNQL